MIFIDAMPAELFAGVFLSVLFLAWRYSHVV
jgi:hypothetical protein